MIKLNLNVSFLVFPLEREATQVQQHNSKKNGYENCPDKQTRYSRVIYYTLVHSSSSSSIATF